jgi:hypothetical protein
VGRWRKDWMTLQRKYLDISMSIRHKVSLTTKEGRIKLSKGRVLGSTQMKDSRTLSGGYKKAE